jgi:hypothetical protein
MWNLALRPKSGGKLRGQCPYIDDDLSATKSSFKLAWPLYITRACHGFWSPLRLKKSLLSLHLDLLRPRHVSQEGKVHRV